jgi:hypothetical protein
MYKNLSITLLLVVFGLIANRSDVVAATPITSPVIVQKLILRNHEGPIAPTTLFTPSQTGLYRISVYMTQTVPSTLGANPWTFTLAGWSDDAGPECCAQVLGLASNATPPTAYAYFWPQAGNSAPPSGSVVIEAVGGQSISYSVDGVPGTTGTYSVYAVVERLM